jgi:hypothetical protein
MDQSQEVAPLTGLRLIGSTTARSESKCNFFKGKCCMTKTYKQLTMDERTFIQLGLMMALKPAQNAFSVG